MDDLNNLDETLTKPIGHSYESCTYCSGYYGPCFGEPLCATCHEYLYTEDFANFQYIMPTSSLSNEKDDGDSGNDEPSGNEEAPLPAILPPQGHPQPPPNIVQAPQDPIEEELDAEQVEEEEEILEVPNGHGQVAEAVEFQPEAEGENFLEYIPGIQPSAIVWPPISPHPSNVYAERMENRIALLSIPRADYDKVPNEDVSLKMPPEIWVTIFKKLDDISLIMASKVNKRWKQIIQELVPNSKWEEFTKARWPLFHPIYAPLDWYSIYSDFIESVPCKYCFMDLTKELPEIDMNIRSLRSVRLNRELKWMKVDHPEGIEAAPLDKLNYNWLARINGPTVSPGFPAYSGEYQGGVFYINLKIPHDYPLKPPIARFLTKIFHPNVSIHGDIGIDCIQHNWTLALTIPQILLSVQSLLTDPYIKVNMNSRAAQLYVNDKPTFEKIARVTTWRYAFHEAFVH